MQRNDEFSIALLKMASASHYFLALMTASREMLGKSYFSLGLAEKQAVDQAVLGSVGTILNLITPEWLGVSAPEPKGFQAPPFVTESS